MLIIRVFARCCGVALVGGLLTVFSGCATTPDPDEPSPGEIAERIAFFEPHLLLTSPAPYPALFVEVDVVDGAKPDGDTLPLMKQFLEANCDKPGGIRMIIDNTIPRSVAEGRTSRSLALEYMGGPPDQQTAFLYVLFYDSNLSPEKKSRPEAMFLPYPGAIFIDNQYGPFSESGNTSFGQLAIIHEAGHTLGLTRNQTHSDGVHCTNENCLMNPAITLRISRMILGMDPWKQREICRDCKADLIASRASSPAPNLRYAGPYFVREEDTYQVITLPGYVYVHIGAPETLDREDLARERAETVGKLKTPGGVFFTISANSREEAEAAVASISRDPLETVRQAGAALRHQLEVNNQQEAASL